MGHTVYSIPQVEFLLQNYFELKERTFGGTQRYSETSLVDAVPSGPRDPFGAQLPHASLPFDGKTKARAAQDVLVSLIDLEQGLEKVSQDDLELLWLYYLYGSHTLDELCRLKGTKSRGSMYSRVQRAVGRLVDVMEGR